MAREYGVELTPMEEIKNMDAVVLAVAHDAFTALTEADFAAMYADSSRKVLVDVKGLLNRRSYEEKGYCYWRL